MIRSLRALETEAGLDLEVRFDPSQRFHCLFGANGVGKTHFLEHLARTLLYSHTIFDLPVVHDDLVHRALGGLTMRLAREIEVDGQAVKKGERDPWSSCEFERVHSLRRDWRIDRPIVFIGTRKRGYTSNIDPNQLKLLGGVRERFVEIFEKTWRAAAGEQVELTEPAEWFASRILINPAFVSGSEPDTDAVIEVLRLLQRLDPDNFSQLLVGEPPHEKPNFPYRRGAMFFDGRPIDKLSTGYVAVLKIFQEIIAGYSGWTALMAPDRAGDPIRETSGVVFIDELEAHLHPQWQARIVDIFKDAFPNTTFYVTTHSPLIVRGTEPGEALELHREGERVVSRQLGSPRDWYLADIYDEAFHVDLPLPGQDASGAERSIREVMLEFSNSVRQYTSGQDDEARRAALALHDEVDRRLPAGDPRRRSLASLRELLG